MLTKSLLGLTRLKKLCVSAGISWSYPPHCVELQQRFLGSITVTVPSAGKPVIHELFCTSVLLSLVLMTKLLDNLIRGMASSPAWQETSVSALDRSCTCFTGESVSKVPLTRLLE